MGRSRVSGAPWMRGPRTRLQSSGADHSQRAWHRDRCCCPGVGAVRAQNGVCGWARPTLILRAEAQSCALRQPAATLNHILDEVSEKAVRRGLTPKVLYALLKGA